MNQEILNWLEENVEREIVAVIAAKYPFLNFEDCSLSRAVAWCIHYKLGSSPC